MSDSTLSAPPNRTPFNWASFLMVVLGMGGVLIFLGVAGAGLVGGIYTLFSPVTETANAPQLFSYTVGGVFLSLLLAPSIVLGIRRLSRRTEEDTLPFWGRVFHALHPKKLIWLYPLVILLGWGVNRFPTVSWLVMPLLNMFALGIPASWLLWVGMRGFEPRSAKRKWNALALGLTIGPWTIFVLEILAMLLILFVGIIFLPNVPSGQEILDTFRMTEVTGGISEEGITRLLQNPLVIGVLLVFISGIVPIVEEVLKPVAVWVLWGRDLTLQDGWALGLLSGGGFALLENFGNVSVGDGWAFIAVARAGATALHMFNTGLIGYTFVLARQKKRILPPIVALAAAILVHAAWNAMTVLATVESLTLPADSAGWPTVFILMMVGMSVSLMVGIYLINRRLANFPVEAGISGVETYAPADSSPENMKRE